MTQIESTDVVTNSMLRKQTGAGPGAGQVVSTYQRSHNFTYLVIFFTDKQR